MPPPTSTAAPTAPDPVSDFYTSKAQASALLTSSPIAYLNQTDMKLHAATITSVSPTQIVLSVPSAPGGTVTIPLTGDGTANIPICSVAA